MMTRRCGTCKHFEQSPLWRQGWCRNPLLYTAQQSHFVSADELDCERGMGNYWEPAGASQHPDQPFDEDIAREFASQSQRSTPISSGGQPIYPVSGSSGYGGDPPPPPGSGDPGGSPRWPDDRGDYGYYDDERYWTDYLRIAAPILGVLLLVALLWFWFANWIGDDDPEEAANTGGTPFPTTQVTPSETAGAGGTEGGITLPTAPPNGTAAGTGTEASTGTEDTGGTGELANGVEAQVANTGGTGVNVRSAPSTDSEILTVYLDGTPVTIVGESVDAEGFTWWPVSGEGVEKGYIASDYLEPTQ